MTHLNGLEVIEDIDQWATEALSDASIEAIAEQNYELFMSFSASLGELVLRQEGIEIGENETIS